MFEARTPVESPSRRSMMNTRFAFAMVLVMELAGCVVQTGPDMQGFPARTILDPLLTRRNPSAGVLSVRREAATSADECRHRHPPAGHAGEDAPAPAFLRARCRLPADRE